MNDSPLDPRVAALWIVHGRACADLLRAHGRDRHAENYEAAMAEIMQIVAEEVGQSELTQALDWVTDNLWAGDASGARREVKN